MDLRDEVREIWDENAVFWDERMGEGNLFHLQLIAPAIERLLGVRPGERILDVGCGNGQLSRRLAELGAVVHGIDISARMIEIARQRTDARADLAGRATFDVVDATDEAALRSLAGSGSDFDAVVSAMVLMDIPEIAPIFRGAPALMRPGGRFVFAQTHPCFNHAGMTMRLGSETVDGKVVNRRSVEIGSYKGTGATRGVAMIGQPRSQWYFDRTLAELLGAAFAAGLVLDGIEEPSFSTPPDDEPVLSWTRMTEIPPILACRLRPA